jgi:hypothetical protein
MTWKDSGQGRKTLQNQIQLVTRTDRQNTIVRIKSSLPTFPPCLPSPALTNNIKNLPLSDHPISPLILFVNQNKLHRLKLDCLFIIENRKF